MTARDDAKAALCRIGNRGDASFDLAAAALALASIDRPGVSLGRYTEHFDLLSADLGRISAGAKTLEDRIATLNHVIYATHGYQGDRRTYDDLQNANMMRVIDRRRGLPVALGILCTHAARAQGWEISGLRFPGHFLLRMEHAGRRAILDPFEQGAERSASDLRDLLRAQGDDSMELQPRHYESASDWEVLLRLQNNIRMRQMQSGNSRQAAQTIETMLWMAPDDKTLWREKALLDARIGHVDEAVMALEEYIARETLDGPRHEAAILLQKLRGNAG